MVCVQRRFGREGEALFCTWLATSWWVRLKVGYGLCCVGFEMFNGVLDVSLKWCVTTKLYELVQPTIVIYIYIFFFTFEVVCFCIYNFFVTLFIGRMKDLK